MQNKYTIEYIVWVNTACRAKYARAAPVFYVKTVRYNTQRYLLFIHCSNVFLYSELRRKNAFTFGTQWKT